jgi:putative hydrolase of the HAD superfamily
MTTKINKIVIFDLDDTLYNEIDFLKSAFKKIAQVVAINTKVKEVYIFKDMLGFFRSKQNSFELITKKYDTTLSVTELIKIYRTHEPKLDLSLTNIETLDYLKRNGVIMGLITDGRSIQQRNKIRALGLDAYFSEIIISEEFGSKKPDVKNFEYFKEIFGKGKYYYIGDNLVKDFIAPNNLNWTTICLLDNGFNIHPQDFNLPISYLPKYKVKKLNEILQLIDL